MLENVASASVVCQTAQLLMFQSVTPTSAYPKQKNVMQPATTMCVAPKNKEEKIEEPSSKKLVLHLRPTTYKDVESPFLHRRWERKENAPLLQQR